jgi:hypothetical protein
VPPDAGWKPALPGSAMTVDTPTTVIAPYSPLRRGGFVAANAATKTGWSSFQRVTSKKRLDSGRLPRGTGKASLAPTLAMTVDTPTTVIAPYSPLRRGGFVAANAVIAAFSLRKHGSRRSQVPQ